MRCHVLTAAIALTLAAPAFAEGDPVKGEKTLKACKACHSVIDNEGTIIFKGGRTGPNLYGVFGSQAGSGDFKYSKDLVKAGEAGLIWDEASLAAFVSDPRGFLKEQGTAGRTKMTFKLRKGGEDVAAYLATLVPAGVEGTPASDAKSE